MKQIAVAILSLKSNVSYSFRKPFSPVLFNRLTVTLFILFLFFAEIIRVYLVMPFPGSQQGDTLGFAHWFTINIGWIRAITAIIICVAFIRVYKQGRRWEKFCLFFAVGSYILVFFMINYRLSAEAIFQQPSTKAFVPINTAEDRTKLVIGVVVNGEAKAYPIQLIGYHHQVLDTVGNQPLIVTYCTVCRSGRVFSTMVDGRPERFRLVGMDHYNAVFEDATTKSWWQQATGEAIAGPRKGTVLKEIPSQQLTIAAWTREHPDATIMAPDTLYDERYFKLEDYDRGTMQSSLVRRDYRSWQLKSWVIGVKDKTSSVAYDWNELVKKKLIQDSLQSLPVLVALESDTTTFHVFDRRLNGSVLMFNPQISNNHFSDLSTNSTWNMDGQCIEGPLKGKQLATVQAYNEFWHAWQTFQPNVRKYVSK